MHSLSWKTGVVTHDDLTALTGAPPATLNPSACNCSICRRYGTLWAYYPAADVRVIAADGALDAYSHGPRELRFVRCRACGCVTHWEHLVPEPGSKMGVNARNLDLDVREGIPVFPLDGANDRWDD